MPRHGRAPPARTGSPDRARRAGVGKTSLVQASCPRAAASRGSRRSVRDLLTRVLSPLAGRGPSAGELTLAAALSSEVGSRPRDSRRVRHLAAQLQPAVLVVEDVTADGATLDYCATSVPGFKGPPPCCDDLRDDALARDHPCAGARRARQHGGQPAAADVASPRTREVPRDMAAPRRADRATVRASRAILLSTSARCWPARMSVVPPTVVRRLFWPGVRTAEPGGADFAGPDCRA